MSDHENLTGGNSNQVKQVGQTVIRQTGKWSPFVHQLLRFLAEKGFEESPVLLETTSSTETLTFIEGEVGNDPLKPSMLTENSVMSAGKLLRRFHDLTQDFVVPADAQFFLPLIPDIPHEVICHNDFAPYNCVYRDGEIIGIIDFDTASPGSRLWDMAYAVYRFVPLMTDQHCIEHGWQSPPDRANRLKLFVDAYGLADRSSLIDMVIRRIQTLVQFMRENDFNLSHIPTYEQDLAYIHVNRQLFDEVIRL